jgi:hypothetical protein
MPDIAPQARNLNMQTAHDQRVHVRLDHLEAYVCGVLRLVERLCDELGVSPEVEYNVGQSNRRAEQRVNAPGPDTGKEPSDADAV